MFIRRSHGSRLSAIVRSEKKIPFAFIDTDGWKLTALFDIQIMSSDRQIMSKRKSNQLLQLILKSWYKPIHKMDLQRAIRIALTEKKTRT